MELAPASCGLARLHRTRVANPAKWQLRIRSPWPIETLGRTLNPWTFASFPSHGHSRVGNRLLLQGDRGRRSSWQATIAGTIHPISLHRRHEHNGNPRVTTDPPVISQARSDALREQQISEGSVDVIRAKKDLLDALDSVKRSADRGALYMLETRLAKALPHRSDAASIVSDIGRLVGELELLKQERAALTAFRHQTPKEIRGEYFQMMMTGLFTGLAAAIHPILFIGSLYGLIRIRRASKAETDRDAGTNRLEEISRVMKEKKGDLNSLLSVLSQMVKES